ncbi:MAG: gamma-glutamyltransferase [Planctomycetota bacterium]|nr:MAG: gamma-glutamyltransferase [Planctomycetota bacterium]
MMPANRKAIDTELVDPQGRSRAPQRIAYARGGMVSTAHDAASTIGAAVLADGGNAIDAAVACAFALGVCEPQASGLGGQTSLLMHLAEKHRSVAIDGSSRAPNRVKPGALSKRERRQGLKATTVPTTVATLGYVLSRYGTMSLGSILSRVIPLAEDGFEWSQLQSDLSKRESKLLKSQNACEVFMRRVERKGARPAYRVHRPGDIIRQPALANTLRRLGEVGVEDFYQGQIAETIAADMEARGGLIRMDDLARIPWPIEREPIKTAFLNHRIVTFPPPGAGGVLIEMLRLIEQFPQRLWDPHNPRGAVLLAEIMQHAALHRQDRPFDPDYYTQTVDRRVESEKYPLRVARQIRKRIRTSGETTHLSVMDKFGNVVGLTQSIERVFGAGVMTPSLGFLYNNYMMAFEHEDISHPYYLRPNAIPWGSVAPTIVFKGRTPWVCLGSPGSERIVTAILQVLLRLLTGFDPYEAVAAPRMHCSTAGKVSLEAPRFRDDVFAALERLGYTIDKRDEFSFYLGSVQLVMRERNAFIGVADPRRDGSARGASA